MRGRVKARGDAYRLVLFGAWRTAGFSRADDLKPFSHYDKAAAKQGGSAAKPANAALATFLNIQASGVPMSIKRIR